MGWRYLRANGYLLWFSFWHVPLIWYCRPRIVALDDNAVTVKIALRRRTRNHLHSLYFGALAIGADVAGAFLALDKARRHHIKIALAFKEVKGQFYRRAMQDVHFYCADGALIDDMLTRARTDGQRINQQVTVIASCPDDSEIIAKFTLTLSVKCL